MQKRTEPKPEKHWIALQVFSTTAKHLVKWPVSQRLE